MSLFKEWQNLIGNQTDETFKEFWDKYSSTEKRIYDHILSDPKAPFEGNFKEMAERFQADPVIFMGFLDGIQSSLTKDFAKELEAFDETSSFTLSIDLEKLYYNMLAAGADYLYELPQWETLLTDERREEILKSYKRSKTVVKEKTPGRNDPCPCGSGKKYKKCCGQN